MSRPVATKQFSITEYKAHCTQILRDLESPDDEIIITRHGKPYAYTKLVKEKPKPVSILGLGIGTITFASNYDPHESVFDEDEWDKNVKDPTVD